MIRGLQFLPHMARLRFLPELHIYTVDGEDGQLASLTTILKAEGIQTYNGGPSASWAMQVGTWVHQAVAWQEDGTLDRDTVSDGVLAYLDSYLGWKRTAMFEPFIIEEPMWHPVLRFAGTPDLFGKIGGVWHVVELKTGGRRAGDRVQVGGQSILIRACVAGLSQMPMRGMVVYLKDNGGMAGIEPIDPFAMEREAEVFKAALTTYRWKAANP